MPCRGKCSFNWLVGYPKPQDIREHLHTCWLVLLHQKPAGSVKAELTVGIRAFIKIGHHSCSHGWFCWGEKRHLAQIRRKTSLPAPMGQEGQSPNGWDFKSPPQSLHSSYSISTRDSCPGCSPAGFYLFTFVENKTASPKDSA